MLGWRLARWFGWVFDVWKRRWGWRRLVSWLWQGMREVAGRQGGAGVVRRRIMVWFFRGIVVVL